MSRFYTENGFEGSRYDRNLTTTDISKEIRKYVKKEFPDYKFSVRTSSFAGGSSICVSLMEYPVELTNHDRMRKYLDEHFNRDYDWVYTPTHGDMVYNQMTEEQKNDAVDYRVENIGYDQLNNYHLDSATWINPEILKVLKDVNNYVNSFNYDDSDSMTDYFDVNFYYSMEIGRGYDHPAKLVA